MFDFISFTKNFRDMRGLTQKETGELLGTHPMSVQKVEAGETDFKDGALRVLETLNKMKTDTLLIHKRLNGMEKERINLNLLTDPEILMHHGVVGYGISTPDGPIAAEDKPDYKKSKKESKDVQAVYLTPEERRLIHLAREENYQQAIIILLEKMNSKK